MPPLVGALHPMNDPVNDPTIDKAIAFRAELKVFILAAVDKDEPVGGLREDEPWFGAESRLGLDSLDALQISMAIQKKYGVRMADSKDTRRALVSLLTLAEYLRDHRLVP